jgi:hypothetical protein
VRWVPISCKHTTVSWLFGRMRLCFSSAAVTWCAATVQHTPLSEYTWSGFCGWDLAWAEVVKEEGVGNQVVYAVVVHCAIVKLCFSAEVLG